MPSAVVSPVRSLKKSRRSMDPSALPAITLVTGGRLCQRRHQPKLAGPGPAGRVTISRRTESRRMNIFKTLAVKDIDEATRAIPLIDVGPAFRGEPGAVELVAAAIRSACENIGFFYLAGHGIPQALVDDAFAASREFHAM